MKLLFSAQIHGQICVLNLPEIHSKKNILLRIKITEMSFSKLLSQSLTLKAPHGRIQTARPASGEISHSRVLPGSYCKHAHLPSSLTLSCHLVIELRSWVD